jgi:aryl-alcohol dehydrogenase-like predicted oxidoreductase
MRYRTIGSSDLQVSEISLGSWLTYSGGVEADAIRACTEAAFEAGINFFDTANVYSLGSSEEITGQTLLSMTTRDEVVIATKVHGQMRPGPNGHGLSREAIMTEIDHSLRRLGTDFVDLY